MQPLLAIAGNLADMASLLERPGKPGCGFLVIFNDQDSQVIPIIPFLCRMERVSGDGSYGKGPVTFCVPRRGRPTCLAWQHSPARLIGDQPRFNGRATNSEFSPR